jgi:YhcH/YjgK/YiaL family protein
MVTDVLVNASLYAGLGDRIARALKWAQDMDPASLELGRIDIDGNRLFALVSDYQTKPLIDGRWEAHRGYLDLQCVAEGIERIGYAPIASLVATDYIPERDITWLEGEGSFVTLEPGRFILLWPGDGHMPGVAVEDPRHVRKVVIKIAVD